MNFAIVDDDRVFAKELAARIYAVCAENSVVSDIEYFENPDTILIDEKFEKFHIIFMDIEMPGMNGIEVTQEINRLRTSDTTPYIVFVTAQDNMVFEALRQFPYSFIRKSSVTDVDKCILNLYRKMESAPTYSVKNGRSVVVLDIDKIIYLEKQGNYVTFHTTEGEFQERSSIGKKYADLMALGFVRPHIGCLVNAAHITEFNSSVILLSDGTEVSLSRSYKKECREKFHEWMVKNL